MEDAMVINRGSLQRGFAHGQVYKPEIIDLKDVEKSAAQVGVLFLSFSWFSFWKSIWLHDHRSDIFNAIHQNLHCSNFSMQTDCLTQGRTYKKMIPTTGSFAWE